MVRSQVWTFNLPSANQIELYQSTLAMPWKEFQATVNRSDRKRFIL